jgi:hypothetical protein
MKAVIQVTKENGKDMGVIGNSMIGEIHPPTDPKSRSMIMSFHIKTMMLGLKAALDNPEPSEGFNRIETIEELGKLEALDRLGLMSYPLQYREDGAIDGFKPNVEVVIERL